MWSSVSRKRRRTTTELPAASGLGGRPTQDDGDEDGEGGLPFVLPKLMGMGSAQICTQTNHIYFNDDITPESVFALNKELRSLETKFRVLSLTHGTEIPTIYLHLTTNGGCIHSAFSVIDCIRTLDAPVHTVCEGFVASAGTLISLAGDERTISPNAYMLIHELRSAVTWGKMSSIDEEYANLKKVMEHITAYYVERTHLTRKALEKILTKDVIWNAEECIAKGLVTGLYEKK